ncbi:MAG: beta-aspartyl-peptidase [Burkholderiaceae bacterium]
MFTLIKNGAVYSPDSLGQQDVLLCAGKIVAIAPEIAAATLSAPCQVIDATGKIVTPGLIDQHVHLIGGGGEGGLGTRTPPVSFSKLVMAGLSTVVGVLGTDGSSRSPRDLYAKAMGFRQEGLSTFMHTGSYQVPTVTITGSIRDDLIFIDPVMGVKIAMADHRGSFPTSEELLRLISDVRMGGMLAGKKGVLHIHLGALPGAFEQINALVERGIPRHHFSPTHTARCQRLFADAVEFAKLGGHIDITSGGSCAFESPAHAVAAALAAGVDASRITISSDGNGSMPVFNAAGEMVAIAAADVDSNLKLLPKLTALGVPFEAALAMTTRNVAESVGIAKGELKVGADADVCVLDQALGLDTLIARGRTLVAGGAQIVRGNFE